MDKRTILAIALSLLVLLTWSAWVSKTHHIENKEVTIKTPASAPAPASAAATPLFASVVSAGPKQLPETLVKSAQEKIEITFEETQAAIKEVVFKIHGGHKFVLKDGFALADPALLFRKQSITPEAAVFVHSDLNKKIIKHFIFSKSNYELWLEIRIENIGSAALNIDLPLVLGTLDFAPANIQARYQDVAVGTPEKTLHLNGRKELNFTSVKFISLRDRYFCAIIAPEAEQYAGFIHKLSPQEAQVGLSTKSIIIPVGQSFGQKFHIYLGPQDLHYINRIDPNWSAIVYYGTFDFIAQILLQLLEFLYRLVHNWGWAIVIFSIVVYLVLFPLSMKQMRSMKDMQALQPKIEELRKNYKDNPQKLNKEIMELYRLHKVNPFGGCLPLILQMPIFFALYQALLRSAFLKGASFLWIKDLSEPDRLFLLPVSLPLLGNEVNILPIVMAIGMFVQQKISMVSTTSEAAEQQKMMLILFPLMFGVIFYKMPSGLVLYWFINSTLTLLYQFKIRQAK